MSHQLAADLIRAGLKTDRVGRAITVLDEIDSTNSYALDRIAAEQGRSSDGHVVFAELQTAGRGRLGRSWHTPRGAGLTFTTLIWSEPGALTPARLIMTAAIAVARAIERTTDVTPVIRWPNDIYVRDRKLAGILVEARACGNQPMPVAIGIGLNCLQHPAHFHPDIRDAATSLEIEARHPIDRIAVAKAIIEELDRCLSFRTNVSDDDVTREWRERSADIGQRVTLKSGPNLYRGQVVDVNPRSGLLLQLDTGGRMEFDLATISRV